MKCVALQMAKYWNKVPREAAKFPLLYLEQTRSICIRHNIGRPSSTLGLKVKNDLFKVSSNKSILQDFC